MVVLTGSGPNTAIVHIKYEKPHWELKERDNQWQHNKHAQVETVCKTVLKKVQGVPQSQAMAKP